MEPMLETFIYETTTLLDQLDEILLASEKSKSISGDNINEIFRIMHTTKGSAAMMGLESISNLAHAVEDVFFIIREDPSRMQSVSEAIFDLVFQASDYFKAEVESLQGDSYSPADPTGMIAQLEKQAAIMKGEAAAEPAAPAASAAASPAPAKTESAPGMQKIRVFFEDGCQMENIRAFMLITQLKDVCEELESVPDHPENDASVCSEIIKNGLLLSVRPAGTLDEVLKVIEDAVNVKSYETIEEPAPAAEPAGKEESPAPEKAQAAPSAPAPSASSAQPPKVTKQSLISVNQAKLDQLMDLVGELVTAESMVASNPDLKGLTLDNFTKSTRELRKLTDELQDVVMSMRMVPLSGTFQKMNRIVRDMSKKLGKDVELETIGGETEVDKTINDAIADPFMHMIRNSMDHAIEPADVRASLGKPATGKITIAAQNIGGEIVITISDDGSGLDTKKIMQKAKNNGLLTKPEKEYTEKEIAHLIMLPGFSTNDVVTEYSGRGVGMDVVRKNIEKVGGSISVDTQPNVGTTFTIKIPLTLAIVEGMEISVGGNIFTLPITSITQSFKITEPQQIICNTDGTEMIMLRGECYPVIRLHNFFGIDTAVTEMIDGILIQIESDHKTVCIFADELIGEQQVVVKPFPSLLSHYDIKGRGLSGCTILGDGSISLILDANNLIRAYGG
ncbi:MAG: chemotaxis protein CheA [Provencibacterium sp.]|nr:chemotaxis protein CheA [Provencibacterium sp.]